MFTFLKDSVEKMKRLNWEKIFANNMSDKGPRSRIYKEVSKLIRRKQTIQF